jgi:hypothetical protein
LLGGLIGDLSDGVLNFPIDSQLTDQLEARYDEKNAGGLLSSLLGNSKLELTANLVGGAAALPAAGLTWTSDDSTLSLLADPGVAKDVSAGIEAAGSVCQVFVKGTLLGLKVLSLGSINVEVSIPNSNIKTTKKVDIFSLL